MSEVSPAFRRAAGRATTRPFFLAAALSTYREMNGLDEHDLCAFLGCTPEDLPRLALCRCPGGSPEVFRGEIAHLATRFHLHGAHLATLVRAVEAIDALRSLVAENPQTGLLAARDREVGEEGGIYEGDEP